MAAAKEEEEDHSVTMGFIRIRIRWVEGLIISRRNTKGEVEGLIYDRFGDFDGFVFVTKHGHAVLGKQEDHVKPVEFCARGRGHDSFLI